MGTLWNPSQLQTRGSSTTTSSGKSTSAPNSSGGYATSGTLPIRRPINLSTSTSTRQLLGHHTTAPSFGNSGMGNVVRSNKEGESVLLVLLLLSQPPPPSATPAWATSSESTRRVSLCCWCCCCYCCHSPLLLRQLRHGQRRQLGATRRVSRRR